MRTCTRRFEFDAAHRVTRHESKCRNLHGHRYVVDVTVAAGGLDKVGRVIDFGALKTIAGEWLDRHFDHGAILNNEDTELIHFLHAQGWKHYVMNGEPTAENLAELICSGLRDVFTETAIIVERVVVFETPNCSAAYP